MPHACNAALLQCRTLAHCNPGHLPSSVSVSVSASASASMSVSVCARGVEVMDLVGTCAGTFRGFGSTHAQRKFFCRPKCGSVAPNPGVSLQVCLRLWLSLCESTRECVSACRRTRVHACTQAVAVAVRACFSLHPTVCAFVRLSCVLFNQ